MDAYRKPPAPPSNTIRRFRPDGGSGPLAFAAAIGAALAIGAGAGIVAGLTVAVVKPWVLYVAVLPIPIAIAVGKAVAWAGGHMKLRAPNRAFAAAAVGAVLGIGVVHVAQYDHFRVQPHATLLGGERTADQLLRDLTGHDGFVGYMIASARSGVAIVPSDGFVDDGPRLRGSLVWALWLAQLAVAIGLAGWIAVGRARQPFCATCQAWFSEHPTQLATGGAGSNRFVGSIAAALDAGDVEVVATELAAPPQSASTYVLIANACATCTSLAVTLRAVGNNGRKLRISDGATWTMTAADAQAITAAIAERRASA